MKPKLKRLGSLWLAALMGLAACTKPAPKQVMITEAQAQAVVLQAIALGLAGKMDELCQLARTPSMCAHILEDTPSRKVPTEPPQIACIYGLPLVGDTDGYSPGGQVVVVTGRNGADEPFVTEVFAFHTGERIALINAVWWSNYGYGRALPGEPVATTAQNEVRGCPSR